MSANIDEVLESINIVIDDVLNSLIKDHTLCALLDFPCHPNVGDSAIWLGEKIYLRQHNIKVVYKSDISTYSYSKLKSHINQGAILIHGGGNFGDIWPNHQHFRERLLQEFQNTRVIQLPQTIHFKNLDNLRRAKKIFSSHDNFILLVRDHRSLDIARNDITDNAFLCPDMAFQIKEIDYLSEDVDSKIMCLLRTDHESLGNKMVLAGDNCIVADWLKEPSTVIGKCASMMQQMVANYPSLFSELSRFIQGSYDFIANTRLQYGVSLLGQGKVVVTDRLHAHILCMLMRTPHVLIDNNYGKISEFYKTWTYESPITWRAESLDEGYEIATSLL